MERASLIARLLAAKAATGMTFSHIAQSLGVTNVYAAQLFYNQAQLKPRTAEKLVQLFNERDAPLMAGDVQRMQAAPMRSWDDDTVKEPNVYRTVEACQHYAESLKQIVNEKFGDGIMSAIDFYVDIEKVIGAYGEARVLLTFNGKFLPFTDQLTAIEEKTTRPGQASNFPAAPSSPSTISLPKLLRPRGDYTPPNTVLALRGAEKAAFVRDLHLLKANVGLTFDQLAAQLGVTNMYAAQLLNNQAQLKPATAAKLQKILPGITAEHLAIMALPPFREWDPTVVREPLIYRTLEGCYHNALGIKAVLNEEFGDGIMSAIDFFMAVRRGQGSHGEPRIVISFNGKFLPHVEQLAEEAAATTFE